MIPWRLRFTGIRDYGMTDFDLSGTEDHILISGPNGSGKSTITFCMGAVLYSSKVDIEGLKSNNLPADQTWRAKIEFLFKNDGDVKVDAPTYVQFRLNIEQHPGEPIKKEFYIEEGDACDQWERTTKYTSGNLFEYKNQLLYKYAVDPDSFYLIWYQKEVNQFAIMHPEERFRIFSEMNGIDTIQKNWEESKELVRETEQSLQEAESKQELNKLKLKTKEGELDRYHDRNRRLREGFKDYYRSLKWLVADYSKQAQYTKEQIDTLEETKATIQDDKVSQQVALEQKQATEKDIETSIGQVEQQEEQLVEQSKAKGAERKAATDKLETVSKEIETITEKMKQINMSEPDVLSQLDDTHKHHDKQHEAKENYETALLEKGRALRQCIGKSSELNVRIDQDNETEQQVRELIKTYGSSNKVQQQMNDNEQLISAKKDRLRELKRVKVERQEEHERLKHNKVLSPRQVEALTYFERQDVDVYPLRELLELDEQASPQDERLFDAIKYTMFVNKRQFNAPNDLYYVPLPTIVPEQALTELPDQRLSIKENLSDKVEAYALKALWWVHLFFSGKDPQLVRGQIVDERGVRGKQEDNKIILSEKMLQRYRQDIEKELTDIMNEEHQLEKEIPEWDDRNSTLFGRREKLKEAEAFLVKTNEREWRQTQYHQLKETEKSLEAEQQTIQEKLYALNASMAESKQKITQLEGYAKIFAEYRKEKERIEEVQQLQNKIAQLLTDEEQIKRRLDELDSKLTKDRRKVKMIGRQIEDIKTKIDDQVREMAAIDRQMDYKNEEQLTEEEAYSRTSFELQKLIEETTRLYEQFEEDIEDIPEWNRPKAEEVRQRAEITYTQAVQERGIDEAAPENYRKMKAEFDQSAEEVKKSKLLLEEHTERMERLKEELEDTIQMKMINVHHKFVHYMSLFGFQGKVEWDMYEDKRGQARYTLAIKARKEGHRGQLEDVSEKARGGKHGKGVSGGEESLSSLLFALALLQTIEAVPGYIVLDEFDSALDETRKDTVFTLYEQELQRKMIIITPKSHESDYLYRFSKAYVVYHDSSVPKSNVIKVRQTDTANV